MENSTIFINDFDSLNEKILYILDNEDDSEVLVSGVFDNFSYKKILNTVLSSKKTRKNKIIIPYISGSGIISRAYINKICVSKSELRANSQFKNNIIVVGNHVFVLSFSYKHDKEYGVKTIFECCILTNDPNAVEATRNSFQAAWDKGFPLSND